MRINPARRRQAIGVNFRNPLANKHLILVCSALSPLAGAVNDGIVRRGDIFFVRHGLARCHERGGKTNGEYAFHADVSQRPEAFCFQ